MRVLFFLACISISACVKRGSSSDRKGKETNINVPGIIHPGDTLRGRAVHIVDGDTYDLLVNGNQTVRIRCFGIDAPERGQDFYKKSKQQLGALLRGDMLTVVVTGSAGGQRKAAKTYNNGNWVDEEMIRSGMAWHFTRYSQEAELASAEQDARKAGRGLWSMGDPVAPWVWRSQHRKEH